MAWDVLRSIGAPVALAVAACVGCGRSEASGSTGKAGGHTPAAGAGSCGHAACGDNFFVDTLPDQACMAGESCTVNVKLVALGDYHVNDEYPYRFKADEIDGIQFMGTDAAGKNIFSKPAGNWRKTDEKGGVMAVNFFPSTPGTHTISGTFKLSVCSAANCLLEQRPVTASLVAH